MILTYIFQSQVLFNFLILKGIVYQTKQSYKDTLTQLLPPLLSQQINQIND